MSRFSHYLALPTQRVSGQLLVQYKDPLNSAFFNVSSPTPSLHHSMSQGTDPLTHALRFASPGKALVVDTAVVEAVGDTQNALRSVGTRTDGSSAVESGVPVAAEATNPEATVSAYFAGERLDTRVYRCGATRRLAFAFSSGTAPASSRLQG